MAARTCDHPSCDRVSVVEVFSALGDPTRLAIVRLLDAADNEVPWGEIDLPIAPSTLSHHLKVLRNAGVVFSRQEGTRCFVSLRRAEIEGRFPGLLDLAADEVVAR